MKPCVLSSAGEVELHIQKRPSGPPALLHNGTAPQTHVALGKDSGTTTGWAVPPTPRPRADAGREPRETATEPVAAAAEEEEEEEEEEEVGVETESVFLSKNNTVVETHVGATVLLNCRIQRDAEYGAVSFPLCFCLDQLILEKTIFFTLAR